MRSLVLVGHGSHLNSESAAAVYRYAELIRSRGLFDEVVEGYWKEEPSLRQVLKTCTYTDVTIIPMFISEGYFTETVIPREMGLGHQGVVPREGVARSLGGRTVRYTLPYGVHPAMTEVILERAREVLPDAGGDDTALIIIGHGTTRNENSNKVVHQNAELLRQRGIFSEVHALFLDEEPKVTGWREKVHAKRVVMVPFFASEGWHTLETIPEDLDLEGTVTVFSSQIEAGQAEGAPEGAGEQTVYYGKPVGTHPAVADVIVQLAEEARGASVTGGDRAQDHRAAWDAFMALARGGVRMGEIMVTPHGMGTPSGGLFEVRHALDEGRSSETLTTLVTPDGLRDHTRLTESGEHRPVHTLRNLRRGWRAVLNEEDLPRAIHTLYPAVVEEGYACQTHALRSTPWPTTARRQTGIYGKVQQATPAQVEHVAEEICGGCLKTRVWAGQRLNQTFFGGVPGAIPCAEACTFLVAEIREEVAGKRGQAGGHSH